MAGCAQYSAVPTGCNVPTRPRVGLLDRVSSEDPLLLDENRAGLITALFVGPHSRSDVPY